MIPTYEFRTSTVLLLVNFAGFCRILLQQGDIAIWF